MGNNYNNRNAEIPSFTGIRLSSMMWWIFGLTATPLACILFNISSGRFFSLRQSVVLQGFTSVINFAAMVALAINYLKLSSYSDRYKKGGIFIFALCGVKLFSFLASFLTKMMIEILPYKAAAVGIGITNIVISILTFVFGLLAVYNYSKGHCELIGYEDEKLGNMWGKFFLVYIGTMALSLIITIIFTFGLYNLLGYINYVTTFISVAISTFECVLLALTANKCREIK